MNKIRILQVVDGFRMGGAENKLCELVKNLDPDKFQILIANVGPSGPLEDSFRKLGVPIFQCQRKFAFDIFPFLKLLNIIRENRIDIVQTTLFWADFIGALASRFANLKAVISWETVTHEGDPYHFKWQRRVGYNYAMKFVDKVVAVSNEIKESLIRRRDLPEDKIQVIHYGVDLDKFCPNGKLNDLKNELGFKNEEIVVAIIARLEKVKGHKFYIQAFQRLAEKYRDVSTILVGDGSQMPKLQHLVQESGVKDRIRFIGIRKDVDKILNAIDIFVLPSIAGEGLPNVILEAMACGKPVIATTVGGIPEAVRDGINGFLVPPKDINALAKAVEKFLLRPENIRLYGQKARSIMENEFSLHKQIASFEKLYEDLSQQNVVP